MTATTPNQLIDGASATLEALNLRLHRQWIVKCQSHIQTNTPQRRASTLEDFVETCFAHVLYSDLTCIVERSSLPNGLHEWTRKTLAGQFILQIQACEVVTDPSASEKHRMCKFVLTDGCVNVVAIELQRIDGLSDKLCVGQKLAVRDATIRRGVIMLTLDDTALLGGACNVNFEHSVDTPLRPVANIQTTTINQSPISIDSHRHIDHNVSPSDHRHLPTPSTAQTSTVRPHPGQHISQPHREPVHLVDYVSLPPLEAATQLSQSQRAHMSRRSEHPSPRHTQSDNILSQSHRPSQSVAEPVQQIQSTNYSSHVAPESPQFVDELDIDDMNDVSQARLSTFYDEPAALVDDLEFDDDPLMPVKHEPHVIPQVKNQPVDDNLNSAEQDSTRQSNRHHPTMQFAPARQLLNPSVNSITENQTISKSIVPVISSIVNQYSSNMNVSQPSVINMYSSQTNGPFSQSSISSAAPLTPLTPPTPTSSTSRSPQPVSRSPHPPSLFSASNSFHANSHALSPLTNTSKSVSKLSVKPPSSTRPSLFSSNKSKLNIFASSSSRDSREIPSTMDDVFDLPMTQDASAFEGVDDSMMLDLDMNEDDDDLRDDMKTTTDADAFDLDSPTEAVAANNGMSDDHQDEPPPNEDVVYEDFDEEQTHELSTRTTLSHRVDRISQLNQARPGVTRHSAVKSVSSQVLQSDGAGEDHALDNHNEFSSTTAITNTSSRLPVDELSLHDLPPLECGTLDPAGTSQSSQHTAALVNHDRNSAGIASQFQPTQSQPHPNTSLRGSIGPEFNGKKEVVLIDSDDDEALKQEQGRMPPQSPALNAFAAAILNPSNFRPFCFLGDLGTLCRSPSMNVIKVLSVKAFILSSISFRYVPRFELVVWVDDGTAVCRMQVSPELLERDAWHCSANELQANKKLFEERRENAERFLARMEGVMTIRMAPGRIIDGGEFTGRVVCDPDPIILSVSPPNTQSALAMRQTAMVRANTRGHIV